MKKDNIEETAQALELGIASFQRAFKLFLNENDGDVELAVMLTKAWWEGMMKGANNRSEMDNLDGLL